MTVHVFFEGLLVLLPLKKKVGYTVTNTTTPPVATPTSQYTVLKNTHIKIMIDIYSAHS